MMGEAGMARWATGSHRQVQRSRFPEGTAHSGLRPGTLLHRHSTMGVSGSCPPNHAAGAQGWLDKAAGAEG